MKLRRVIIERFKGIKHCEFDLTGSDGQPRQRFTLTGDNGTGKTSVLQAIAWVVGQATQRFKSYEEFAWHGFRPERIGTQGPTHIELAIEFDADEISATHELFERWQDHLTEIQRQRMDPLIPPGKYTEVTLTYLKGQGVRAKEGAEALFQFRGRDYIKCLVSSDPSAGEEFARVGDVFWLDQMRNLGTIWADSDNKEGISSEPQQEGWHAGVEQLRKYLLGWWGYHRSQYAKQKPDYLKELEARYSDLFEGARFIGIEPMETPNGNLSPEDFYFFIDRGGAVYDLSEMSSGEQAVFPILYNFVRHRIAKSLVLIDELELHLHGPAQQALYSYLPKLGPDCQFLLTTHSKFLADAIPAEHKVQLEGGRPCL